MATHSPKPLVFLDADVIFAGSASPSLHSASNVVLQMSEITLIDAVTSEQVIVEVERNLRARLSAKLPEFRLLIGRALRVVPDPAPEALTPFIGQADPKDLPILVAAIQNDCSHLLTFNLRHYAPSSRTITVQRPGTFLQTVRYLLSSGFSM